VSSFLTFFYVYFVVLLRLAGDLTHSQTQWASGVDAKDSVIAREIVKGVLISSVKTERNAATLAGYTKRFLLSTSQYQGNTGCPLVWTFALRR
jgi:hypothetical protein